MALCCGTGNGFSWAFMIGMVLMFAGCFFMMMMHRKKGSMDCCTKSKTISDNKQ